MEALYKEYRNNDRVAMFFVYVNEAHPKKEPGIDPEAREFHGIGDHRTIDDKVLAASKCMEGLKLSLPALIDDLDGAAERAYRGKPAATAVVDMEGKVVFYSRGPWGTKPDDARTHIRRLLADAAGE